MGKTLLKHCKITDLHHDGETRDILIEGKKIIEVATEIQCRDAEVRDMAGYTIIPGLVNAHTHIRNHGYSDEKFADMAKAGLAAAVDMSSQTDESLERVMAWRRSVATDDYPELYFPGRVITIPGGYGSYAPGGTVIGTIVNSVEEAVQAVDDTLAAGADGIKIGCDRFGLPLEKAVNIPYEMMKAVCDECEKKGVQAAAHVLETAYLRQFLDAGIDIVAHSIYDRVLTSDEIQEMVEKNIIMTPTLILFYKQHHALSYDTDPAELLRRVPQVTPDFTVAQTNAMNFYHAGGMIAAGTDLFWVRDKYLIPIEEMQMFTMSGMSVRETVIAATYNGAKLMRKEHQFGSIAAGQDANIIAVEGELDTQFEKLIEPKLVIYKGRVMAER